MFEIETGDGDVNVNCGRLRITKANGSFNGGAGFFAGALSHEGDEVGFFNKEPQPFSVVTFLTGTENLLQTQDKINQLLSALGSTSSGVGIIKNS
jgi:hypothetical protein